MWKPILSAFAFLVTASANSENIWLKGGTLLDPGRKKAEEVTLCLRQGRIHRIKPPFVIPAKEKQFDLKGRYLIPGLYDLHAHTTFGNPGPGNVRQTLTPLEVSRLILSAGVTGILDLSADEDIIFKARSEARKRHDVATLFAAGPMVTCPRGHGSDLGYPTRTVSNPKEAEKQINDLAKHHPDVVKIAFDHAGEQTAPKPVMDVPTLKAVIRTAKRHRIKTIVHIGNWDDAREAVLAGADAITHLYETDIPDSLVKLMKAKKAVEIPTMTYQTELLRILENRTLLGSPLVASLLSSEVLAAYRSMSPEEPYTKMILDWQARGRASYPKSLAKLIQSKVPILCGTDAGDLGVVFGYSVHREMAIMVEAGATPWEALNAASTASKKFLGRPSGISEGDLADLVVLKANPLKDISNTQSIEMVFHDGKLVEMSKSVPTVSR